MADRPMLFQAPMVRALLAGTKTQTRRALSEQPPAGQRPVRVLRRPEGAAPFYAFEWRSLHNAYLRDVPVRFAVGDRLWVRETWTAQMTHGWTIADARSRMFNQEIIYAADGNHSIDGWWPSIHMPREFSRLTLTVTEVRVERLQSISGRDSIAEGVECETCIAMRTSACLRLGCFLRSPRIATSGTSSTANAPAVPGMQTRGSRPFPLPSIVGTSTRQGRPCSERPGRPRR